MHHSFGKNITMSVFGESHQACVGVVIDGLPAGKMIHQEVLNQLLSKRQPGNRGMTQRKETDDYQIVSGLYQGKFDGSALMALFQNTNQQSKDYPMMFRPSHSDYPAYVKYKGFNDPRGGGQFSGRLTLPMTFAGGILEGLLLEEGIQCKAVFKQIGQLQVNTSEVTEEILQYVEGLNGDSCGGQIDLVISGVPVGVGEPLFDSIESMLSHLLFSIPGVKGVVFGDGIEMSCGLGSQMNDALVKEKQVIVPVTNHNGGITGGMSNGADIVCHIYLKPTPSIALAQMTYDPVTDKEGTLEIKGRHDPCFALRALPVIEACGAFVIYDLLQEVD